MLAWSSQSLLDNMFLLYAIFFTIDRTYIFSLSCRTCINFLEEGLCKLMEGVEVLFRVKVGEEVCERKHIASSRRAARSAVGDPSFCWGVDSAGTRVPATFRAAASLRSVVFSLNSLSFNAFKLATSFVRRSFAFINFCILSSISSIFAFFLSRDVCAATRFFNFLFRKK